MNNIEKNSNNIFTDDISNLVNNINNIFKQYENKFNIRNRSIDFIDTIYFISNYNSNINSSYNTTITNLYNNSETELVTYQAYINKRDKIDISIIQEINNKLISYFYNHITKDKINNSISKKKLDINKIITLDIDNKNNVDVVNISSVDINNKDNVDVNNKDNVDVNVVNISSVNINNNKSVLDIDNIDINNKKSILVIDSIDINNKKNVDNVDNVDSKSNINNIKNIDSKNVVNKNYRIISADGSQLNFINSLKSNFKANKNDTYSYANLSCLFDVDLKIPISYVIDNKDERTLLISQLDHLNENDILVADRGYYSNQLINELKKKNINFVLRISKHISYYINNKEHINKTKEGNIIIEPDNNYNKKLNLFWYHTRNDKNKDIELEKTNTKINDNKNNILELKKKINELEINISNIFNENKSLIIKINNLKVKNKSIKDIENRIKENRINRNNLKKELSILNEKKIELDNILNELYNSKKELELDIKSNYIILTNLTTMSLDDIKTIYKKRWEVETHFRFAKKLFKFDSMNTKNIKYVKQNILITQLIFIIEGYIEYILSKKIDKKNKMINRTKSFESLKNKLLYLILKNSLIQNNIPEIIKLILAIIITLLEIKFNFKYKPRIRKRPQKNHYNSNIK